MAYKTTCPECGHELEWYAAIYDHDEGCCCIANCPNCGVEFRDIYAMEWKRSEYTLPKDDIEEEEDKLMEIDRLQKELKKAKADLAKIRERHDDSQT